MQKKTGSEAELLVWTDVDPAGEEDFNRWYDEEHMEERVAIPGFRWARRYRASDDDARRYLALYRTAGFDSFTSPAYKQAFENQTEWSYRNFDRMRNTKRRVSRVALETGLGSGAAVALASLTSQQADADALGKVLTEICAQQGVLAARVLEPDSALSTPLPSEDRENRKLEALVVLEANSEATAARALAGLLEALSLPAERGQTFALLWGLRAEDLQSGGGEA